MRNSVSASGLVLFLGTLLFGCGGGGGGGGSEEEYAVSASSICVDTFNRSVDCRSGGIGPNSVSVKQGQTASFEISPEGGLATQISTSCPPGSPLENLRQTQGANGSVVYLGLFRGTRYVTGPIDDFCYVMAIFTPEIRITTIADINGSIVPENPEVVAGSSMTFEIDADDGFAILEANGCNGSLDGSTYRTGNVYSDCVIEVTFVEIPDLAGTWAGTWQGFDPAVGRVAGTWVTELSQDQAQLSGPIEFGGDIDCAEGHMTGVSNPGRQEISGRVTRDPCPSNSWRFNAFDETETSASGTWHKSISSQGSFEGRRIASPGGPVIRYVYPPAAGSGAYVTLVGERLDMDLVNDSLALGSGGSLLVADTASENRIRIKLPAMTEVNESFYLTTPGGTAISPLPFNTAAANPNLGFTRDIPLGSPTAAPAAIAYAVNNRRAFVANRGDGSVSMINTEMGEEWTTTTIGTPQVPANVHAIAVHPDGRRVYAAGDGVVGVLHAHTLALQQVLTAPNDSGLANPRGIAVSPDGRWLLLSQAAPGGVVSVLDIDNGHALGGSLQMPAGSTARGIAVSPDNRRAYIAVSGSEPGVRIYDLELSVEDTQIELGTDPIGVAVIPDAGRIYVINEASARLHYYDVDTAASGEVNLGNGVRPTSLAITPDGAKVFVSTSGVLVYVVDVITDAVVSVNVGGASSAIAISRDGRRAYATLAAGNRVVNISDQRSLRIGKQGGGIGTVRTDPGGINCGSSCIATFALGQQVTLIATAPSGYQFRGWSGDDDCLDGTVSMLDDLYCVARFEAVVVGPLPPGTVRSCFIATAAYGSWLEPEVETLRVFRDQQLLSNAAGRWFVDFYYRHSPPVADYIRERESLRAAVRAVLAIVVMAVRYPLIALTIILLPLVFRFRRGLIVRGAAVVHAVTG